MAIEWRLALGALIVGLALVAIALFQGCGSGSSGTEGDPSEDSAALRPAQPDETIQAACGREGTRPQGFTGAALDGAPANLRLVYASSSGRGPCGAEVRHRGREIWVTLRVTDPQVDTADLRPWCAQGILPAGFDAGPIRDDVGGAAPSPSGADRRLLESGHSCVLIPIAVAD